MRIGVLGTANIAERRMIPAILKSEDFEYAGVAIATKEETGDGYSSISFESVKQRRIEKAEDFVQRFGGEYIVGYEAMLKRPDIDAVYIPLPPALHYRWAKIAIYYGKHILLEKPFTTDLEDTRDLVSKAQIKNIALLENYGFCYHKQMQQIYNTISSGEIGQLRLIRLSFGFPHRDNSDFRYSKKMGGGALFDCGGYTLKAASLFLGNDACVVDHMSIVTEGHEVDVFGTASMRGQDGLTAQVSYGMDNFYKCELELWGSTGCIRAPRIFTAPEGFAAPVFIQNDLESKQLSAEDDQFLRILDKFKKCIDNSSERCDTYSEIILQSNLIDQCIMK